MKIRRVALLTTLALAAGAASCGGSSDAGTTTTTQAPAATAPVAVQELEVVATDHTFAIYPEGELRPGWTELRLRNDGAEAHQIMFARLKDDVDPDEVAAAAAGDSSGAGAIEFVDMLGGVSYIGPGHEITALVDLPEGPVMAMCYVPDANGVAHALMGMTATLQVGGGQVGGGDTPVDGDEPLAGTIELAEDGYQLPDTWEPGWYHVVNTDDQLHELSLMRLDRAPDPAETETMVADLAANRVPAIDLEATGGMGAVSPGFDGYLYLDLAPGTYLAVDFMPDPGEPRPHMLDGYYATFEV
jgi:hypothetical protein